jgi:hypothetical protein
VDLGLVPAREVGDIETVGEVTSVARRARGARDRARLARWWIIRDLGGTSKKKGVSVLRDKELQLEEGEVSYTMGGSVWNTPLK